jgi:hypothetical protein
MTFYLEAYDRKTEWLVARYPLVGLTASQIRLLFDEPSNAVMYGLFPVTEAQVTELQEYTDHALRLEDYDYFVVNRASP